MSIEAEIEADQLAYQFHISAPSDNESVAAVLAQGLADTKRAWQAARDAGDLAAEQKLSEEWQDLVVLLGAAVDGLRAQRRTIATYGMPRAVVLFLPPDW
jgi:hypothetical protein